MKHAATIIEEIQAEITKIENRHRFCENEVSCAESDSKIRGLELAIEIIERHNI